MTAIPDIPWEIKVDSSGRSFKQQDGFQHGGFLGGPFQNRTIPEGLTCTMFMGDDGKESISITDGKERWFYVQEFGKPLHDWTR
jgi:hypothetical protein